MSVDHTAHATQFTSSPRLSDLTTDQFRLCVHISAWQLVAPDCTDGGRLSGHVAWLDATPTFVVYLSRRE